MNILEVNFPIFPLRSIKKYWEENKIIYVQTVRRIYILDNKNLNYKTLGERRLRIKSAPLYPLNKAIYTIAQLIRHSKTNLYIDNFGNIFKYVKKVYTPLKYHKIKGFKYIDNVGYLLEIQGLNHSILVPYIISIFSTDMWAGILHSKYGYILYDIKDFKDKDRKLKI